MAQTAVEWLQQRFYFTDTVAKLFEQAKEMEKEQIVDFAKQWEARQNDGNLDTIEMLYNETYNK
jgi:hypothetical protein